MKKGDVKSGWKENLLRRIAKWLGVGLPRDTVYVDPLERLFELDDSKSKFFVWKFKKGVSDVFVRELLDELDSRFVRSVGRSPESLHVFLKGDKFLGVDSLGDEELERLVIPWLKAKKK